MSDVALDLVICAPVRNLSVSLHVQGVDLLAAETTHVLKQS